ncbi:MAG: hypothetical protein L3K17_05820 [Thermoplasmata archaeon]|nr:hypothetical protein [Thermoplasmata archaeon]
MSTPGRLARAISIATLQRSRVELRGPAARALAIGVGVVYGFVALQVGLMLTFGPTAQTSTSWYVLWGNQQSAWWNYPAILVIFPGGVLALPFFATLVMVLVSAGVGIGMGVGILLTVRVIRLRRRELGRPASAGAVAGLTPAMIGLVTLGACCSTTAAATAGIGALAQASGSSLDAVLANNWYIGVFQLAVLWVALVAQEQLLSVYGVLLGTPNSASTLTPAFPRLDRRLTLAIGLRVALILAGVTWALAGIAQWGFGGSVGPPASNWVGWVLTHGFLSVFAVIVGIFPETIVRGMAALGPSSRAVIRLALIVGGVSLLTWLPPTLASSGWHGLVNELLAGAGAPTSWGALPAGDLGTTALILRWAFQFLLLGGFSLAVGVAPGRSLSSVVPGMAAFHPSDRAKAGRAPEPFPAEVRAAPALDPGADTPDNPLAGPRSASSSSR